MLLSSINSLILLSRIFQIIDPIIESMHLGQYKLWLEGSISILFLRKLKVASFLILEIIHTAFKYGDKISWYKEKICNVSTTKEQIFCSILAYVMN